MADFDPTTPSIARVYDYLLNGKDNFAVDREVADKLLAVAPIAALVMRENRQFLARAARWAAEQGISQFIDLGLRHADDAEHPPERAGGRPRARTSPTSTPTRSSSRTCARSPRRATRG